MLFTDFALDDRLQRGLATAGFVTPTPIQATALPMALAGRDLLGTAQTGTGKTAAYVLPILQQLLGTPLEERKSRALILAPTRELVVQILTVIRQLGVHTNVRAIAVYGGVAMPQQTRALRNGVELIVATPGRLLDHMKRRNTDFRQLDFLVLDEADRMLDMGFMPAIQEIIDMLPAKRQTMLFTATFPKALNMFMQKTLRDPARVQVDNAVPAKTVRHSLYQVKDRMKPVMLTALLRQLIPESEAVLIFTQTRITANDVARHLTDAGMDADVLHAEKTQRERTDTLNRFRAGAFPYLVATDIAARGIDVTSISHVINYDLPGKPDDYLHRIGRTGRMERAGHAISLMTRGDVRAVREIERMLGKRIEVERLTSDDAQQMSDNIPNVPDGVTPPPRHQRAGRPEHTRQDEAPPAKAERPSHRRSAVTPPSPRNAGPRKPFSRDGQTERAEQSEHAGGRRFTGIAAASKYNRKHAAGKRQPGEVPSGPRPAARPEPITPRSQRNRRTAGRRR